MGLRKHRDIRREDSIIYGADEKNNRKSIEQYTRLKDNILCFGVDGKKVIQIESSLEREGKTTTVGNLAVALGLSGKKVVAVDFDFIRGKLHRLFLIENKEGLVDYILGDTTKEKMIKKTQYENVDLINRGHGSKTSSIILTSQKMQKLFEELRKEYDYIILDCPPIILVSDYLHIAKLADGVLFVVAYGITKRKHVSEAIQLMRSSNMNIIGSIFSYYDPKISDTYYDYNDKAYYNYYYHSDERPKAKVEEE